MDRFGPVPSRSFSLGASTAMTLLLSACSGASTGATDGALTTTSEHADWSHASSPSAASQADASASASAGSEQPGEFTSELYGYSLTLPAGWRADPAERAWDPTRLPYPGDPGIDTFTGPFVSPMSVRAFAAARPIEPGEDLSAAADALVDEIAVTVAVCGEPLARADTEIAGEPALLLTFYCEDGFDVLDAVTVRADEVYVVGYIAPEGDADAAQAAFDDLLASISIP